MHVTGKFFEVHFGTDGSVFLMFKINERKKALAELDAIKDLDKVTIDVEKYRDARSNAANAYMWQLLDKIAKALSTEGNRVTRWDAYKAEVSKYGVFTDLDVPGDAEDDLRRMKETFRCIEVMDEYATVDGMRKTVRCFYGSHIYNTKEMSDLIDGIVDDAQALGIETLTPDEQKALLQAFESGKAKRVQESGRGPEIGREETKNGIHEEA